MRSFEEETAKLAARLVSDATNQAISVADVEVAYAAAERASKLKRRVTASIVTAVVAGLIWFAGIALKNAADEQQRRKVATWIQQAEVMAAAPGPQMLDALIYASGAVHESDDPEARKVLLRLLARLLPIQNSITPYTTERSSEQTQVAALFGDDQWLATGGRDGILHVANAVTGEAKASMVLESARIRSIVPVEDGKLLAIGSDRGIRLVSVTSADGQVSLRLIASALEKERIGGLDLDRRGTLYAGTFGGSIWRFTGNDLAAGATRSQGEPFLRVLDPRYTTPPLDGVPVGIFGLAARGDKLIVAGIDGVLTVYDLSQKPVKITSQIVHPNSIFGMDVTRDGSAIAIADDEGEISIYGPALDSRRIARLRAPDPASAAEMPDGRWSSARPDEVPTVGIAFDATSSVVAVTGHDRTVKFLLVDGLEPLGMLVHGKATRGVVFSPKGVVAHTFGDDGVIFVTKPLQRDGEVRLGSIDGLAVATGSSKIGYWIDDGKNTTHVFGLSPGRISTIDRLGQTDGSAWNGLAINSSTLVIRKAGSTVVDVFSFDTAMPPPCGGTGLAHPNEDGNVQFVERLMRGTRDAEIATVAAIQGANSSVLRLWRAEGCSVQWELPFEGQASLVAVASGTAAVVRSDMRIEIHKPGAPSAAAAIEADTEVTALTIGTNAQAIAFQLKDFGTCLCVPVKGRQGATACPVKTNQFDCRRLEVSGSFAGRLEMSASGSHLLIFSGSAIALASKDRDWLVTEVAPVQVRSIEPPFAFFPDEGLLAVPESDTGIRILNPHTLETKALLPTPSRVMKLAFLEDGSNRLVSLDGKVMRVWDWRKDELIREACQRWPVGVEALARAGVPPPLARIEVCGAE